MKTDEELWEEAVKITGSLRIMSKLNTQKKHTKNLNEQSNLFPTAKTQINKEIEQEDLTLEQKEALWKAKEKMLSQLIDINKRKQQSEN